VRCAKRIAFTSLNTAKANGVTFEGAVPAEHKVSFSITDSTHFRAPMMTLTHRGGVDIGELDRGLVAQVPFNPLTGLKAFVVANALAALKAPKEIIFVPGAALAEAAGAVPQLRHDHTRIEPDPHVCRARRPLVPVRPRRRSRISG
jgi:succinyl-CoA synthetase beta subunit